MSFLAQIKNSVEPVGSRIVIAAQEKMGKTTLTCGAPKSLLVPLEQGFSGVKVDHLPLITSWQDLQNALAEITYYAQQGQFPYKSLIFDSTTALERLIHEAVLMKDTNYVKNNGKGVTMESALGGYGKAYSFANDLFGQFLNTCDQLATYAKINIVLTCHVFASRVTDPINGEYDSWDLLLHSPKNQKTYGKREMLTQWADVIGFLHEPMIVIKSDDSKVVRGVSKNVGRVLGMTRTFSYVAGNRYGVENEIQIPKEGGWNEMAKAIYNACGVNVYNSPN